MANVEDILARCLADLERGDSVEDCLARYPEWRDELEPLVRAAHLVRSAPDVAPSAAFRETARQRIARRIRDLESARERGSGIERTGLLVQLWSAVRVPIRVRRFAVPTLAAIAVILLLGSLGVGAVRASAETLPGDSLYPVKLAGERVRLALSVSDSREASLHLRFAGERLEEASTLLKEDRRDGIEPLMGGYATHVEAAGSALERQHARGQDVEALAVRFQEQLTRHEVILRRLQEKASDQAQLAVEQALAASRRAQHQVPWQPPFSPTPEPTSTPTATSTPTESPTSISPSESRDTATPRDTSEPAEGSSATETFVPPGHTRTPEPPGQTKTPQPPGQTKTAQPSGHADTPQPPGQTKTPEPPGQTRTPQPPGLTRTPQAPGLARTPGARD